MKKSLFLILGIVCLVACNPFKKETRFQLLPSSQTGITFNNLIAENDTFNVLRFEYLYNGAGVGVGDVNNDGLPDVFFTGNQVSSRLYLNRGDFKFEDVTGKAGVGTKLWCTGVAMADINQDGLLDVYVSTVQPMKEKKPVPHLLFLNKGMDSQGIPHFEEVAANVGLADSSYATQMAFLDYDLDGDMDAYLLNNALESYNRNNPMGQRTDGGGKSVDRLYRNEGIGTGGLPFFTDVSKQAGIQTEGWGLGIVVNDLNQDGYPDVYVANDFLSNDHAYINNRNGTFTNQIHTLFKHTEHNGMGVDIADINNDGLNDVVAMDMMPDDNLRQKTMFSSINYDRFYENRTRGYLDQYVRNVLQLNNGNGTFSDIGYLAGVNATDWSWSSLFADFDNDGYRDLLVTNGYRKDVTDLDFITYSRESSMFGTDSTRMKTSMTAVNALEGVKKPNFLFRNNGDLTFADKAAEWGLAQPSYSNGAAYADFDNDGDLDLVMNNINDEAFVYRNNLINKTDGAKPGAGNNFLRVKLKGAKGNDQGMGAKLWLHTNGKVQYAEHELQRGYKSTVEEHEHFGLGNAQKIDSLRITWQGGKNQTLKNISANQVIVLEEKNAAMPGPLPGSATRPPQPVLFSEVSRMHNLTYTHQEDDFMDFRQGQPLLPHKHSQGGPGIAVGDLNGDGLDDFALGGSVRKPAKLFYQQSGGTFRPDSLPVKTSEDMGLLLFDADGDGDNDLYCVSGSTEFGRNVKEYQDWLYRNLGKGRFQLDTAALPRTESSGSCVTANDFDHDGDLDLFVGGRVSPMRYPEPPRSYLLQNDGKGRFTDATEIVCPGLAKPGMVTAALWTDYDNDGWTDLLLVGEWMAPTFFKNAGGKKFRIQNSEFKNSVGWWNSLVAGDFDNDGDMDYVAGNLGLNSLYKASETEPVCVYAKDYDNNGTLDPILCRYIQGKEYPTHPRETFTDQIVGLRRVLGKYATYGKMSFRDILPEDQTKDALMYQAKYMASAYIENLGKGNFRLRPLPVEAQMSPVFGMVATDFNHDGNLDLLATGNSFSTEVLTGMYDAGIGVCLQGDGRGNFKPVRANDSGFMVDGDAKGFAELTLGNGAALLLVTQNRGDLKVFENSISRKGQTHPLQPGDAYAEITFTDGRKRKQEFHFGSTYLSQSSRTLRIPAGAAKVTVVNTTGRRSELPLR